MQERVTRVRVTKGQKMQVLSAHVSTTPSAVTAAQLPVRLGCFWFSWCGEV
jgi:hypothetical protein